MLSPRPGARTRKKVQPHQLPPQAQDCDWPGCRLAAEHRAPYSRGQLHRYRWFCLEHVRVYNAAWDYYAGMTPAEIETHLRADTTWRRPSWPLGSTPRNEKLHAMFQDINDLADPLDVLSSNGARKPNGKRETGAAADLPKPLREALAVLDVHPPFDWAVIRRRYKVLVKLHHPDANGGDKAAEERLKAINLAYSTLKQWLRAQSS